MQTLLQRPRCEATGRFAPTRSWVLRNLDTDTVWRSSAGGARVSASTAYVHNVLRTNLRQSVGNLPEAQIEPAVLWVKRASVVGLPTAGLRVFLKV